ncbi:ABC-2 type transporter / CDR ABC transporter family protein [Penicillium ucsense]|uniref:ABC-2 type transporter / CDR ABC transporter family protein n=1 Tax=Penicillium ucsense TaxID=2839758 RepID=A0A8J8WA10_9EURO|nr:ABC-2 type transporter / CDR ABC transporter family protein [Penicillium ucsense]KAF7737229.1 ABC-2 type transporter / CDR ABC transporter family protein [Penicillium ucsense]
MDDHHIFQPTIQPSNMQANNRQQSSSSNPTSSSTAWGSISSDSGSSVHHTHKNAHGLEPDSNNLDDDEIRKTISRRKTHVSGHEGEEWAQIEQLISRMFGSERKANSDEEQTRHSGVIWKNLTVKGVGLGAALQPTNGDILLGIPRFFKGLLTRGRRGASGGKSEIRTILDDFSGAVNPGEMLLVLGRPGSGCSTFLKVIGNQRHGYESVEGDVLYGGTDATTMAKKYRSEVSYNPEEDLHYATLTVKETLLFALKSRTPDQNSRIPGESRKEYQQTFLSAIAKLFWIEHALGTKVGNELIRGVSGGEKKRVSIGEAMVTKASTQCWDNSTKGLDASTALEYVQSLRSLTNTANVSTLVALYQASENLYNLFDKVILIEDGKCAFFGRTEEAKAYFENLGFECPPRWTTPDFLTSVSDPHARKVKEGWEDRIPRTAEEFRSLYRQSQIHKNNLKDIENYERQVQETRDEQEAARQKAPKKNFTIPFWKQVAILTHRQFLVMFGDTAALFGKWFVLIFQALIVGSLFYNLPDTSAGVFTRGGVLFYILLFNALLALAELTATFESRPVLLKHKSFSFYRPSAYALAQVVVDVPLVFIQVVLFDLIVYFMSNLARTPSQFFINLFVIFLMTMTMYSFFRACGALCSSLDVATRLTGVAIQALIVYTGYLIPPWQMHPWLKWLIWINPVQYAFEALMSNEFYNLQIQCEPPFIVPQGPNASPEHQTCAIQGSTPGSLIVQGSNYIQTAFTYTRAHLWRNVGIIIAWFILFVALTMLGMELQKPNGGGSSVTVFKRGEEPRAVKEAIDGKKSSGDLESAEKDGLSPEKQGEENGGNVKDIAKNTSVFTWQNVNYTIPYKGGERKLLQNVSGSVKPGRLTALMGASGAGKTTLLNVLAQRVNFGVISGNFLVDGKPLPKSFQRATGFAEQSDIHEPTATVRESLRFSALLRQPKEVPIQEKYDYCEKIIDLLEMRSIAGATVGTAGSGLNQEQRKRLTIAVELASKPELLLFLDEPTSGLDSLAAFNIVRFLRRLADAGQAVFCTIHQPSAVLFEQFDDLLLLKSGGRVVYNGALGSDSRTLIDYFERNGGKKCSPSANPAEYMLEVIGAGNPDYKGQDWGDVWENSTEAKKLSEELEQTVSSRRSQRQGDIMKDDREFATPLHTQVYVVTKRAFVAYWRSPEYISGKILLHIITGLFNTFTFWHLSNGSIGMQSRLFSIFMTLTISPPLIQQLQPKFLHFRGLYESRESNSKIYSWVAFVVSTILPELPYSIVAGSIYFNCWYWGIWFPRDSFSSGYTWMMLMLFECFYVGFGQFIAAFSPNELFASLLVPSFFTFVVSFCGVVVPYAQLPHFWQSWMYWLTPFNYLVEGLLSVVVHNVPVDCLEREEAFFSPPAGETCQSYAGQFVQQAGGTVREAANGLCGYCQYATGDQFAASFNVYYSHKWRDYGIFWAFVLFNFAMVFFFSWIYLHGVQDVKKRVGKWKSGKAMKKEKQDESRSVDES